ncbi:MAG: ABC transporter permease [Planctomycetota bacterium]|jgi:putative ABC transport system permease protein
MGTLWQDIRYGIRMMARNPGFTAVVVLILAIGIGATTTIFSVVNGSLLRPFPYRQPEKLVSIWEESSEAPPFAVWKVISNPNFFDCREAAHTLQDMAMISGTSYAMRHRDRFESVRALGVTSNLFKMLGLRPALGRVFFPGEEENRSRQVVILTEHCWRTWFQSDPNVVGESIILRSVRLGEQSYSIVGVMPPDFTQPVYPMFRADILVPFDVEVGRTDRDDRRYKAIGRLRDSATLRDAQAELDLVSLRLEQEHPKENRGWRLATESLRSQYSGEVSHVLYLLLGASGLLLTIACANVANLLLVRGLERRQEIAVRGALGAGRSCVLHQFAIEGLILAVFSVPLGVLLSLGGLEILRPLILAYVPTVGGIDLDTKVLGFAGLIALVTGVTFGLVPAIQILRTDLSTILKGGSTHATAGIQARRVRMLLVVSQIALAFILIVGAGLAVRTFSNLLRIDPGFNPHNVLAMEIDMPQGRYRGERVDSFHEELLARIRALPGVIAAATSGGLPLVDQGHHFIFDIEGRSASSPDGYDSYSSYVSADYFRTLGVPLLVGRDFQDTARLRSDRRPDRRVVIVNKAFADRFWPAGNPIGQRLKRRYGSDSYEIIGVVEDEYYRTSQLTGKLDISPRTYFNRFCSGTPNVTIRARANPLSLVSAVRAIISELDDQVLVRHVLVMEEYLREQFKSQRLTMLLVGIFAVFAFTLSIIGLYGVIAHSAKSRSHEIAIRMATGATSADIHRMILKQGAKVIVIGMGIGLAGIFGLARLVSSYVYGVAPLDPSTLVGAVLFLAVASILACSVPARRAARIDPMAALRYE